MAVTTRRAVSKDSAKIAELAIELFQLHEQLDPRRFSQLASIEGGTRFYDSRTKADNAAVLVAEQEGRIVGFAYMEYEPVMYAELATKVAWLHDIYVEPGARAGGAGSSLLEAITTEARLQGADKILLTAAAGNSRAQEFFQRNGFRVTMVEMMLDLEA